MERVQGFHNDSVVIIPINTATSAAIPIRGMAQCGFIIPAAFTGASVSFSVSADGTTYAPLHDSTNTLVSRTVTAGKAYALPIDCFPFGYVKLVSASNEAAARTIIVSSKY